MRALLISNSKCHGGGYLDHVIDVIDNFLPGVSNILFVPYAKAASQWDAYTEEVRQRFQEIGVGVTGWHTQNLPHGALKNAQAVFVGGGNTFRLLQTLEKRSYLSALTRLVQEGLPYIGASAGANIASPTIATTNDNPIVWPKSLEAMGLVDFQIKPHFSDKRIAGLMRETDEDRIREYHEENSTPVVALREGSYLKVNDGEVWLDGPHPARVFVKGRDPLECPTNARLSKVIDQQVLAALNTQAA